MTSRAAFLDLSFSMTCSSSSERFLNLSAKSTFFVEEHETRIRETDEGDLNDEVFTMKTARSTNTSVALQSDAIGGRLSQTESRTRP